MIMFHESKMIRMSCIKNVMNSHKNNMLKEGDGIIINNEMYGTWIGFSDIEKGIAKVKINDSFIIEVLISHISLLKNK